MMLVFEDARSNSGLKWKKFQYFILLRNQLRKIWLKALLWHKDVPRYMQISLKMAVAQSGFFWNLIVSDPRTICAFAYVTFLVATTLISNCAFLTWRGKLNLYAYMNKCERFTGLSNLNKYWKGFRATIDNLKSSSLVENSPVWIIEEAC